MTVIILAPSRKVNSTGPAQTNSINSTPMVNIQGQLDALVILREKALDALVIPEDD